MDTHEKSSVNQRPATHRKDEICSVLNSEVTTKDQGKRRVRTLLRLRRRLMRGFRDRCEVAEVANLQAAIYKSCNQTVDSVADGIESGVCDK